MLIPSAAGIESSAAGIETAAIPLQQPFANLSALAAQQFGPETRRADARITFRRRAERRRDPPAGQRRADAQAFVILAVIALVPLSGQQQGGDAGGFRRQLQTPALPQIQTPHLAHHHGQAGAFQPFLHGPQALLVVPPMHQDQLPRAQAKGGQTRPVQAPARWTPQHLTAARAFLPAGKGRPPGRQHGRKGQRRPAPISSLMAAQHFMQTAAEQTAARQDPVNLRHAQAQGGGLPPDLGRGARNGPDGRNAPA